MTKEHLGLALALSVPVFVVVTKVDMCPPNVLQETLKLLTRILKSPGCRKIPVMVQNKDDVICSATNFTSERYVELVLTPFLHEILVIFFLIIIYLEHITANVLKCIFTYYMSFLPLTHNGVKKNKFENCFCYKSILCTDSFNCQN